MQEFFERISKLSPQRLALLALELQGKLEAAERNRHEPIAIIGMGCRFPGAASPADFWDLLRNGVDAIGPIPPSRWDAEAFYDPDPEAPGKIATRWGGFVEPIDTFEPQLFGISPREAQTMDPQQRMLLEVSWEALERAGQGPTQLSGSATGVFVGICNNDYTMLLLQDDPEQIDAYLSSGNAHSVASGRLAYVLGLQGPALSVDTACSSSLVAVHLAVQSLRNGECRMALAGGVNAILSPTTSITLSRAKMMAADGRCKAFDARADGFVRSEGCGMVVLKRLAEAQADGDPILAVIRGSALNQDGRSNGLTAPNGPAQVAVIRAALADAGLQPTAVAYVETHGTGTALGDPIEVQALGAALGVGRDETNRLLIGSVKTNLGHLEAAAGVAGLIKAVLVLQHGHIPPHLHLTRLNPHLAWDELPIDVPAAGSPWPVRPGPRIAGVSSFGFSGTNAHLLLEAAPAPLPSQAQARTSQLLTLSARSAPALRSLAGRFAAHLSAQPELVPADVAYTAATGRTPLPQRLAVVGDDLAHLAALLAAHAAGEEQEELLLGQAEGPRPPAVAFLFTGHGAQYAGMGLQLYQREPVFRAALDRCAAWLDGQLDRPLLSILADEASMRPDGTRVQPLEDIAYAQPALFALQYALAELWQAWGVRPAALLGHSVGEYAAAVVAGCLTLEDGLRLVLARGRLMATLPPDGAMAAVLAEEQQVQTILAPYADRLSLAAINGPASLVIAGHAAAVSAALADLTQAGIETRRLAIPLAAHSPQVEPILDAFGAVAASISYSPARSELVSSLTGQLAAPGDFASASYWRRHLREPVRFADAARLVYERGCRAFVEIGPHPTLIGMARHFLPAAGLAWAPSLRRQQDEQCQVLSGLAALWVAGVRVDWAHFYGDEQRRRVELPTYPFERERYWADLAPRPQTPRPARGSHGLLGPRLHSPAWPGVAFEARLGLAELPFLADHRVFGALVLPSPVLLELALAAARAVDGHVAQRIEQFSIGEALILPETAARIAQIVLGPYADEVAPFQIFSRSEADDAWTLHATGRLRRGAPAPASSFSPEAVQAACPTQLSGADYYVRLADAGLAFGPRFRGLQAIWRRDGEALGLVELPEALVGETSAYSLHPALLDACLHLLGAPLPSSAESGAALLIAIDAFQVHMPAPARLWSHTRLHPNQAASGALLSADLWLYDQQGGLVAEALGLQLRAASRTALLRLTRRHLSDWLYRVDWEAQARRTVAALNPPASVAVVLEPQYALLAAQHDLQSGLAAIPLLEQLSAVYAVRALRQLGWAPVVGSQVQAEALGVQLGVVARHQRLFARLLAILAEEGLLRPAARGWEVVSLLPDLAAQASLSADLRRRLSPASPELALLEPCGEALADLLRGTRDPLQLLFPAGSLALTEPLYRDTPFARVANGLVAETLRAAVAHQSAPLRVIEVGAGSGATTRAALEALAGHKLEYWFTDISPHFTARAATELGAFPALRTHIFDLEHDPLAQGLPEHAFDLVLAANVLHATSDLRRSLGHLQSLLAPGGTLLLLEGTRPFRWVDLTFGLTEGWWRFSDSALRPAHPLLNAESWLKLLHASGFEQPVALPRQPDDGQAVIMARMPLAATAPTGEQWLIFADAGGVGAALAQHLAAAGERTVLVRAGPGLPHVETDGSWLVAPQPAAIRALLSQPALAAPAQRVIYLWGLDQPPAEVSASSLLATQVHACAAALALTSALANTPARLWLVTRGAQPVGPIGGPAGVGQAALWGLGRVIALEQPEIWGGLVDLSPEATPAAAALALLVELSQPDGEDQVALRGDTRLVPRLVRLPAPAPTAFACDPQAAYLITGGLGALGLKLARWLADSGARHLVLTGRRSLPPRDTWPTLAAGSRAAGQVAALQTLEALGVSLTLAPVDVADQQAMQALCARFGADLPPLRGVFHTAAELGSAALRDLTPAALEAMLRPKLAGAWLLHELTAEQPLDAFVLFSSTTALWGSRDLAHYAAANQTLDALAHYRRDLGLPALSINWGTWDEMRVASADEQQTVASYGLGRMPAEQALEALGALLGTALAQVAVAAVDWQVLKPAYEARRPRPLLAHMAVAASSAPPAPAPDDDDRPALLRRIDGLSGSERRQAIAAFVRETVARALGISQVRQIDDRQGLFEMGMDSLMSVELKGRLERSVGQSLPATLTFNYPSVAELTTFFADELLAETPLPAEAPVAPGVPEPPPAVFATDELSEDDLAALLAARLARLQ